MKIRMIIILVVLLCGFAVTTMTVANCKQSSSIPGMFCVNYDEEAGKCIGDKYDFMANWKIAGCDGDDARQTALDSIAADSIARAEAQNSMNKFINGFKRMFGSKIWESGRYYSSDAGRGVKALCRVGLLMAFILVVVQIFLDFVNMVLGQNQHPIKILQKNLAKVLIVAILLTPGIYETIVNGVVAKSADAIANDISAGYKETWLRSIDRGTMALSGMDEDGNKGNSISVFAMSVASSLITYVVGGIIYMISWVLNLIFPLLQSMLFMLAFFLGPICIPFMIFDGTSGIARSWFSFLLTVCFLGVVGSLALLVGTTANFYVDAATGAISGNPLVMIIYGVLSIVLYVMAYPISSSIFGAGGGGGGVGGIMSAGALATGAAVGAAGVAAVASRAGGAVAKMGSNVAGAMGAGGLSEKLGGAASAMSNYGQNAGDVFMNEMGKAVGRQGGRNAPDMGSLIPAGLQSPGSIGAPKWMGGKGLWQSQPQGGQATGSKFSQQYQAQIDAQKNALQSANAAAVADMQSVMPNVNDSQYGGMVKAINNGNYTIDDIASASVSQAAGGGYNIDGVTMNTGEMYRATSGGWEAVTSDAQTSLQQGVNSSISSMSVEEKAAMKETSSRMVTEIRQGGTDFAQRVDNSLSGTGYNAKDVASVQLDRAGGMRGMTMRTGEQLLYDNKRGTVSKV